MKNEEMIELVLVHLGKKIPKALNANISYIKNNFPELSLTVIVDNISNFNDMKKQGIKCRIYEDQNNIERLFHGHQFSSRFRNGFWKSSTKRLFAFLEYFSEESKTPKIHIENDIHLRPNFPYAKFLKLKKLAWLGYNEFRDVGSIIYCPDKDSADWLMDKLISKMSISRDFTDMTLLRDVSSGNPLNIVKLPIAEEPMSVLFSPSVRNEERNQNSEYFEVFNGIFDAAPMGMWITGQDPRNHRGRLLLHRNHADSYIQPSEGDYFFGSDNMLCYSEKKIPIFNLHVHSKETNLLIGNERLLKRYINLAKNKKNLQRFKMSVFVNLALNFLINRVKKVIRGK